jgi:hypothetical protein
LTGSSGRRRSKGERLEGSCLLLRQPARERERQKLHLLASGLLTARLRAAGEEQRLVAQPQPVLAACLGGEAKRGQRAAGAPGGSAASRLGHGGGEEGRS